MENHSVLLDAYRSKKLSLLSVHKVCLMKVRKSILSFAIVMSFASMPSAYAESGAVNFVGTLVDTPCYIDSESKAQYVELGEVSMSQLEAEGESTPVDFNVLLKGCSTSTLDQVVFTFTGSASGADNTSILTGGTAKGLNVAMEKDGTAIVLGSPMAPEDLVEGDNNFTFQAKTVKGDEALVPGAFNAVANFSVEYN